MTEFTGPTGTPDTSAPEKKTPWKIIIPVAIALVLCCICLVVAGILGYMGTQGNGPLRFLATATPTRTPTPEWSIAGDWNLYYDWGCDGDYNGPAYLTFHEDHSFYLLEDSGDLTGIWSLENDFVEFTFDEFPHANYTGVLYYFSGYMEGDMTTDDDQNGCWYAEK